MGRSRLIGVLAIAALACTTDITRPSGSNREDQGSHAMAPKYSLSSAGVAWGGSAEGSGNANPTKVSLASPAGSRGLVVWITQPIVNSDIVTGVAAGGKAMKRVGTYVNQTVNGGRVYCYFLGSNLPTGTFSIAVSRSQSTTMIHVVAEAITGGADLEVIGFSGQAGLIGNPRLTLRAGGRTSVGLTTMYSSIDNVLSAAAELSGQQRVQDHDFGTETSLASRRGIPGSTDVTLGWNMNPGQIAHMAVLVGELADTVLPPPAESARTLIGAGDVHARCTASHPSAQTAALIAKEPDDALVFSNGDNAGVDGSAAEFQCFDGKWGQFKSRMLMAIGNHERRVDTSATAYYDYGNGIGVDSGAVGRRGKGYYAVTYGGWRILVLNSEQNISEQAAWIQTDLSSQSNLCQLAIWHEPLFNSGATPQVGPSVRPLWEALYANGADVIVNAHDHGYQRTVKVRYDGVPDAGGIQQFIAGTGGGVLGRLGASPLAITEKALFAYGVLKLKLYPKRYEWTFVDTAGVDRDSGGNPCH